MTLPICSRASALLLFPVLLLTGCSSLSPQTVAAHKIADALPQTLGPARHYDVQVDGDTLALTRGRARQVRIQGEDVQVAPGAVLDTLDLTAQDVSFDTQTRRLDHVGAVVFAGTMGQAHLSDYLARCRPDLTVTLRQDDVEARLPVAAGPLHTTATVYGNLTPTAPGASTLDFAADRARLSFLPVPAFLVNRALDERNPVVDLSNLRIPVALQSADVENGALVLRGTADLDALTASDSPPR